MTDPTDILRETLTPEELGTLFLFEGLDHEQRAWLSERGRVERRPPGEDVATEGEPATCFFVLLDGTITLLRTMQGNEVILSTTDHRGSYGGATQVWAGDRVAQTYQATFRTVTECRFFMLAAEDFHTLMTTWFPMAVHLLEGLFLALRANQAIVNQRERLLALGSLSAGLTHELNNPAAAAVRATASLRERVAGMRHKLAMLASGQIDAAVLTSLVTLQEHAVEKVAKAPRLSPLDTSDREDALGDWLDHHHVTIGWELAPVFVQAGVDEALLEAVAAAVPSDCLESAMRWLGYTVEIELLMGEIEDSTTRISALVAAAKQYSQIDRSPFQVVDIHELIDSTLIMLGGKISPDVTIVRDYGDDIPPVSAYAAELNQVWTNLVDNALGAMGGRGTLTLRTRLDGASVVVEVGDTGPGVPDAIRSRIFDAFFTTKPVGEGTGLGLDIAWRIVVNKHHGDLRVESTPGNTRFLVRLPIEPPPVGG